MTNCESCGETVSENVEKFSRERWGKVLCYEHQRTAPVRRAKEREPTNNALEEAIGEEPTPAEGKKPALTGIALARKLGLTTSLNGKEFITHGGLLAIAHEMGLHRIFTELVSVDWEKGRAVVRATVTLGDLEKGRVITSGYGDADPSNTSANVKNAFLRMAETRAVNRALRFATNVGLTSLEEMPDDK